MGVKNDENVYALGGSALMVSGGDLLKQVKTEKIVRIAHLIAACHCKFESLQFFASTYYTQ